MKRKRSKRRKLFRRLSLIIAIIIVIAILIVISLPTGTILITDHKAPPAYKTEKELNDRNHVQLLAAEAYGIRPAKNREAAAKMVDKLEKITDTENYEIDHLDYSVPYLTKNAKRLLDIIGRNFSDSLKKRNLAHSRFIVTSLLRTEEDVKRLRASGNQNAARRSTHTYATTFDLTYIRFHTVEPSMFSSETVASPTTLRQILANVVLDLRRQNKCYAIYEQGQHCYHITSRLTDKDK